MLCIIRVCSAHVPPVASKSFVADGRVKVMDVNANVDPVRESSKKDDFMFYALEDVGNRIVRLYAA